uniref:Uncharacterized protein n=1 Tax=Opuntia streptacantha TaxID=393608 RepID=A0A7C9DHK0_OPUST
MTVLTLLHQGWLEFWTQLLWVRMVFFWLTLWLCKVSPLWPWQTRWMLLMLAAKLIIILICILTFRTSRMWRCPQILPSGREVRKGRKLPHKALTDVSSPISAAWDEG